MAIIAFLLHFYCISIALLRGILTIQDSKYKPIFGLCFSKLINTNLQKSASDQVPILESLNL